MDRISNVTPVEEIPEPIDLEKHITTEYDLKVVWRWVRAYNLYNRVLGFRGNFNRALEQGDTHAAKLFTDVAKVKDIILYSSQPVLKPKSIFKFFKCRREGDSIIILGDDGKNKINSLTFPRQDKPPHLCLSDYISDGLDYIAFLVATSGIEYTYYASKWTHESEFKQSVILQSLALATVEAIVEIVHRQIRISWGIEEKVGQDIDSRRHSINRYDETSETRNNVLSNKYRGKRYSFGYASCPDLSQQKVVWDLLNPEQIDVKLTEEYMMEPEASISAMVIHHPEAEYFSV